MAIVMSDKIKKKKKNQTTQSWLRFCAPNAGDLNSTLGQGTKSHMPQPRPGTVK